MQLKKYHIHKHKEGKCLVYHEVIGWVLLEYRKAAHPEDCPHCGHQTCQAQSAGYYRGDEIMCNEKLLLEVYPLPK